MIIAFRTIYDANIICDSEKKLKNWEFFKKKLIFFSSDDFFCEAYARYVPFQLKWTMLFEDCLCLFLEWFFI